MTLLLLLPALSCGSDLPKGTAVPDPDLMALLRPNDPISEERLSGRQRVTATWRTCARGTEAGTWRRTDQLDERGVEVTGTWMPTA